MVKIPGLDDLKKMGAGLIDSAKSVNISETVDKLKSKMEALGGKKEAAVMSGDNPEQVMLANLAASVNELTAMQALQASAIKKIQDQLAELAKVIETKQKPVTATMTIETEFKQEDTKKWCNPGKKKIYDLIANLVSRCCNWWVCLL